MSDNMKLSVKEKIGYSRAITAIAFCMGHGRLLAVVFLHRYLWYFGSCCRNHHDDSPILGHGHRSFIGVVSDRTNNPVGENSVLTFSSEPFLMQFWPFLLLQHPILVKLVKYNLRRSYFTCF
jgi:hypothetical protein